MPGAAASASADPPARTRPAGADLGQPPQGETRKPRPGSRRTTGPRAWKTSEYMEKGHRDRPQIPQQHFSFQITGSPQTTPLPGRTALQPAGAGGPACPDRTGRPGEQGDLPLRTHRRSPPPDLLAWTLSCSTTPCRPEIWAPSGSKPEGRTAYWPIDCLQILQQHTASYRDGQPAQVSRGTQGGEALVLPCRGPVAPDPCPASSSIASMVAR